MKLFDRLVVLTLPLAPKKLVGWVASRYVSGASVADAVAAVRKLNEEGAVATVDILGESVSERDKAEKVVEEYVKLFEIIDAEGIDSNVSIKPTMLGLEFDEQFCKQSIDRIAAAAAKYGNFMRIDMEDRTCTDATIRIYNELQAKYGNLGTVFQSYMRRTLDDIGDLPSEGANIRLCKGIYIEPREVAWKGYETVRANFVAALDKLFRQKVYVGVATHDEYLICRACELVERYGLTTDQFEFQMLLGVDPQLRRLLLDRGFKVRIYVPYGKDWYPYSIRRLRENPTVARHVIRAILSGN